MNSVEHLKNNVCDFETRLAIKNLGAPRPILNISQPDKNGSRVFNRKFSEKHYDFAKWLCGCDKSNAFFCFVCLLCSPRVDAAWTINGVTDLKHLKEKVKKHSSSEKHLNYEVEFSLLGSINIQSQLNSAYRQSIKEHNENVEQNRYILNRIIECIKFCGSFELALRGHDESSDSDNPGVFRGLVDLLGEVDNIFKKHLLKKKSFQGLSKTIQNELLDSMLVVARNFILKEMEQAEFVAIQADETTDISVRNQLVLIVRYTIGSKIYERFWGYFTPESQNAQGISKCILQQLQCLKISEKPLKLIAQSYDGASVMSGSVNGVQALIKQHYPNAHYIHCYAHKLNLVVAKAASCNTNVRVFFSNLDGFPSFFSRSSKRTEVLNSVVKKRLPRGCDTRWTFHSKTVTTIHNHKDDLVKCFEQIISDESDASTIRKAYGLLNLLQDENFLFWLDLFNKIMPHVEILFCQIQKRGIDSVFVKSCIEIFKNHIQNVREGIDDFVCTNQMKRKRSDENKVMNAKEICDIILVSVNDRLSFTGHLSLASLFDTTFFEKYRINFPKYIFDEVLQHYPSIVDNNKLTAELNVLYKRDDFIRAPGISSLLGVMIENNLCDTFSETVKLLNVVCTTPMTTAESERCFSTLKRIKSFLRNTMTQDRLNSLSMLSIERKFISQCENFNELVIDNFASAKTRKMDFLFKSCVR